MFRLGRPTRPRDSPDDTAASWLALVVTAGLVGGATGIVAGSFRVFLARISEWRLDAVHWGHGSPVLGFILVVGSCTGATALAASLVHRVEPHAEGSGIPRVEAVVEGRTEPGRFRILPVKYLGGLLSIGSGLALGREGPSVQMGGNAAIIIGSLTRRSRADIGVLVAAGAAAGLATAFNAPIAGGIFILEELVKRFDHRATLATLVATACGFASAHLFLPAGTEFIMPAISAPELDQAPVVVVVGLVAGVLGILYNTSIMRALKWADTTRVPVELRAALIGLAVGALGWFWPEIVGGGDNLTQRALVGEGTVLGAVAILVVRWVLGVVSYAALTPGGLFAPMLVIGSQLGLLVGLVASHISPGHSPEPAALALIGMAAFFTSSVRAPVTGIILATEMTGNTILLPPILGACAIAMAIPTITGSTPIYDLLTDRAARASALNASERGAGPP